MALTKTDPLALKAGDLRHVITFLKQGTTSDVSGTAITWTDYATVRASIEPFKGTDMIKAGVNVSQVYITVTCRFRDDVSAAMRIQTEHGIYVIQALENILLRNRVMRLTCLALGDNA